MRNIINALLIVDIGIVLFCFLSGERQWLINSQIGFLTSTLVMFASMVSYRNMVSSRIENNLAVPDDNRDTIDKIEDPFDLYGEKNEENQSEKSIQEVVKEEKKRLKENRRSFWQMTKDSKAALSFYRLGAYGLLVLGFFYLNRNGVLHIASYLTALAIPVVIVITLLLRQKGEKS
ncbi:MAG: hypothetical protein IE889_05965 [Campylobacterales bacterium]|nr:hypothetical protein [Campylobacterales bacterium]